MQKEVYAGNANILTNQLTNFSKSISIQNKPFVVNCLGMISIFV